MRPYKSKIISLPLAEWAINARREGDKKKKTKRRLETMVELWFIEDKLD